MSALVWEVYGVSRWTVEPLLVAAFLLPGEAEAWAQAQVDAGGWTDAYVRERGA